MNLESLGYTIYFDNPLGELDRFIAQGNYSKIFFLVDRNTEIHCLPLVIQELNITDYDIIEIDEGEENKNIDFCIGIWKMLLDFGADRKSLMINLGGGVVTDMGSFAAATFKRGIDFVQVPTTLLSQVDASVGGKTGIDMDAVKNIIGTFTQPKAVFIHAEFLKTLPADQLLSGFAEMLKHGLIYDDSYFNKLKDLQPANIKTDEIYHSVSIKNEVVKKDPKEQNLRKILNFGHTIGHAVESYSITKPGKALLHGEAIAIGMICEAWLSVKYAGLAADSLDAISKCFLEKYPPYNIKSEMHRELLLLMQNDKKNESGKIGFALLSEIGVCKYDIYVDEADITKSLAYYKSLMDN